MALKPKHSAIIGVWGMNCKGQAAVTDALFLLVVVGVLSASLVAFSIQYGSTVQKYIASQYIIDYETTALKTILYSSVPRDVPVGSEKITLANSKQVDYLLALVKEDYLGDEKLDGNTFETLRNASRIALKPLSSSFDYLFFIQALEPSNKFVFIYLYSTACTDFKDLPGGGQACIKEGGNEDYYCVAKNMQNIQRFLEDVGAFPSVSSGIKLSKIENQNPVTVSGVAELALWLGTSIEAIKNKSVVVIPSTLELSNMGFSDPNNDVGCNPDPKTLECRGWLVCKKILPAS